MLYKYKHINLTQGFISFIKDHQLIQKNEIVLLAVSGGLDSVVMAYLFYKAKIDFAIAHCNFSLREEADADEAFVRSLAQQYQVNFYAKCFDTCAYAKKNKYSTQMAARELRYKWFNKLCKIYALNKLATAHHANDCLETLLFNLTKGTSIAGLHGILPKQGNVIRPILFAHKEMLLAYAEIHKLSWREDSSNAKDVYARNLIRNKVIPVLKLINPGLETTTSTTIARLSQVEKFFNEQVASLQEQILYQENDIYYLAIEKIRDKSWAPVVLWELLKPFGFNFLQIKNIFHPSVQSGRTIYSDAYQLYIDRTTGMIGTRKQDSISSIDRVTLETKNVTLPAYRLQVQIVPRQGYQIIADSHVAILDLAKLQFPLVIRPWQHGDFFYPLGMQKRKKLSDFLIDLKVPLLLKQRIYVLVAGTSIVWVIGYRVDDRFKVTQATTQVYELRLIHTQAATSDN